jgi:hypothetical protein
MTTGASRPFAPCTVITLIFALRLGEIAFHRHLARLEPSDETREARHLHPFIGKRLRQHRVDAVLRLAAQTRDQAAADIVPDQRAFQQVIGTLEIRLVAQVA